MLALPSRIQNETQAAFRATWRLASTRWLKPKKPGTDRKDLPLHDQQINEKKPSKTAVFTTFYCGKFNTPILTKSATFNNVPRPISAHKKPRFFGCFPNPNTGEFMG